MNSWARNADNSRSTALLGMCADYLSPRCSRSFEGLVMGTRFASLSLLAALLVPLAGCTSPKEYLANCLKVGPNYRRTPAPVAEDWVDAADKRIRKETDDLSAWWTVFNDPALDRLICFAYRQNLTLRQAGFRVLEA